MRVRAFTILEIMIVVLIVTAISAVVIPTLVGRVAESKLGGAVRAVEFAAALAAAEAMQRGEVVAFVAERDGEAWVLYAEPIEPERIGSVFVRASGDELFEPMPDEGQPRPRVELASFEGVEIRDQPVLRMSPGMGGVGGFDEDPFATDAEGDEADAERFGLDVPTARWVLGVFFADGSARPGPTVYLIVDDGREQRSARLRPLTGGIDVATVDPFGDAPPEGETEEADELDDEPMPPPSLPAGAAPGTSRTGEGP
ncbi:MAG: type II secretion system protein [Planctomycetota bacterium]|nr:type II secretion system protein [Planctomycetota bacterium]